MASTRCASCTLRALHFFVRSAGAELLNPIRLTPFQLRNPRPFLPLQPSFRRHQSSLAANPVNEYELDVGTTSKADRPHNLTPEDTNDPVATLQDNQSSSISATNVIGKSKPRQIKERKRTTERKAKRETKSAKHAQESEAIDQNSSSKGKKAGKEKIRTSSRNAEREAARRGLTYNQFQEQNPEHPANVRARRGETKETDARPSKEKTKTRRKQASGDKASSDEPKAAKVASSRKRREGWQVQKTALGEKFQEGWNPHKRLSPDALDGIRGLHQHDPEKFSTAMLSQYFEVSPEVIRRILKSKWKPSGEENEDRMRRWNNRGKKIWEKMVELGVRPPKKWREMGVGRTVQGEAEAWKNHKRARQSMRAESRLADEFEQESNSESSIEQSIGDRIL